MVAPAPQYVVLDPYRQPIYHVVSRGKTLCGIEVPDGEHILEEEPIFAYFCVQCEAIAWFVE